MRAAKAVHVLVEVHHLEAVELCGDFFDLFGLPGLDHFDAFGIPARLVTREVF